jgi:hypothetical protein
LLGLSFVITSSACGSPPATEAPPSAPAPAPAAEAPPPAPSAAPAPAAETPPPAAPEAAAPPAAPTIDWAGMSRDQKLEHMKTIVMPKSKELFAAFDAKEFGNMKCPTCHGDGAKNQTFKMPNPKLPKLSYTDHFKKHMDKKPEETKFMMEKVVPEVAAMLGMQPFDPKTQKGFGCANCHIVGP